VSDWLTEFADIFRQRGPWCLAYVQAATGTVDTLEAGDVLPGNVRTALAGQGASNEDLDAMEEVLSPATGESSPVSRFVLVRHGAVAINERLPRPLVVPERISVDRIAKLLPLVKHRPEDFPYAVAEVSRDEGEIRLHRAGRHGWADSHARLLAIAGDIRARGLVVDQLSEASKAILTIVESHTRTPGADHEKFNTEVVERLAIQEGQANPESATGTGSVIHALQQAQVEVLIFDDEALSERPLLALASEPETATSGEEALGADILSRIPGPVLPEGVDIAALLRWPTGSQAPQT
jgi:hypothetical protein